MIYLCFKTRAVEITEHAFRDMISLQDKIYLVIFMGCGTLGLTLH